MKKLVAVIAAVVMMVVCISAFAAGNIVTKEEAMQAALDYAGLDAGQVTFTRVHLDWDDGRQVYEVEFICNGVEYELDVDALTGRILDADKDHFDRWDRDDDDGDWDDWFDFD